MLSKSLQESNKKFFLKHPKEKMKLQRLQQTEKQLMMLLSKMEMQITELFSLIK